MFDRIALVTDFGAGGPYVGQMLGVLGVTAPGIPVINLVSDLPPFRADLAAYLLPQLVLDLPSNFLYICVVDPGVGSERAILALHADNNWYLAPNNGLLAIVARRAVNCCGWWINWRPSRLSASFHGRDLFAPVAAALANGYGQGMLESPADLREIVGANWSDDLYKVIYQDYYGNLCCGVRANLLARTSCISTSRHSLAFARTFSKIPLGQGFWYENAFGLLELAVNQDSASKVLGLVPGDSIGRVII